MESTELGDDKKVVARDEGGESWKEGFPLLRRPACAGAEYLFLSHLAKKSLS